MDGLVVEFLDTLEGGADGRASALPLLKLVLQGGWETLGEVGRGLPLGEMSLVVGEAAQAVVASWRAVVGEVGAHVVLVRDRLASPRWATVDGLVGGRHCWCVRNAMATLSVEASLSAFACS